MLIEIIDAYTGEITLVPTIAEAEQYIAGRKYARIIDIYINGNDVAYFVNFSSDIPF